MHNNGDLAWQAQGMEQCHTINVQDPYGSLITTVADMKTYNDGIRDQSNQSGLIARGPETAVGLRERFLEELKQKSGIRMGAMLQMGRTASLIALDMYYSPK